LKQADEIFANRIPIIDTQSRFTPNKEGGFASNYTPLATVDVDSGFTILRYTIAKRMRVTLAAIKQQLRKRMHRPLWAKRHGGYAQSCRDG